MRLERVTVATAPQSTPQRGRGQKNRRVIRRPLATSRDRWALHGSRETSSNRLWLPLMWIGS